MKKLLTILALFLSIIGKGYAQVNVYYEELVTDLYVGVGHYQNFSPNLVFSIMTTNKNDHFEGWKFKCVDQDTNETIPYQMTVDTICHNKVKRTFIHTLDYKFKHGDWIKFLKDLEQERCEVYVNDQIFNGQQFLLHLKSIEKKASKHEDPEPGDEFVKLKRKKKTWIRRKN